MTELRYNIIMNDTIDAAVAKFVAAYNISYVDDCDLLYFCLDAIDCKQVAAIDFANAFLAAYNKYVAAVMPLEQFDFNTTDAIIDLFNSYAQFCR